VAAHASGPRRWCRRASLRGEISNRPQSFRLLLRLWLPSEPWPFRFCWGTRLRRRCRRRGGSLECGEDARAVRNRRTPDAICNGYGILFVITGARCCRRGCGFLVALGFDDIRFSDIIRQHTSQVELGRIIARDGFDVIMAWSVDRLGRSLQDLIAFLSEIHAAGVDLYLQQQGLDTCAPSGRAMFQMLGVFAEFERALIRERVMAGLARAKKHGTKTGNPFGRPKIDEKVEATIRKSLLKGAGTKATARAPASALAQW
jgi:hypothetical protein